MLLIKIHCYITHSPYNSQTSQYEFQQEFQKFIKEPLGTEGKPNKYFITFIYKL